MRLSASTSLALVALLPVLSAAAQCPYAGSSSHDVNQAYLFSPHNKAILNYDQDAAASMDFDLVRADLKTLFTTSQPFWPADFGHYGPLFIRLAWHCAGGYRQSDGRGGCDGARMRFDPERSWDDNTNLDKARKLLWPIKQKYGSKLSWGDLIVLAGDTAIESMGGPVFGFCAGRIDDDDGTDSIELGPNVEQQAIAPCPVNGECEYPLGSTTIGLIYVNPEGPMGKPDPAVSATQVRDVFNRMGMDDKETVALIGGGHAFGKTHGACPTGPGPNPSVDPANPWPGTCGSGPMKGKGNNTFTSGFEGVWTSTPTQWGNEYFQNLLKFDWQVHMSPGGHHQWRPTDPNAPYNMLTTDIALLHDPNYKNLVKHFATNLTALNHAFAHAWYKLMTRDMGPYSRCLPTKDLPPPQPFQMPLPPPSPKPFPLYPVKAAITKALTTPSTALAPDMDAAGKPTYTAIFSTLAYQCAATFRSTDYTGGCNGARIRFPPLKDLPENKGLDLALEVLSPIKAHYPTISYADLIVLGGTTAVEAAGSGRIRFCGGRADATSGSHVHVPAPRQWSNEVLQVRDRMKLMNLSAREYVALAARPRSPTLQRLLGYSGTWGPQSVNLTANYFVTLFGESWEKVQSAAGLTEYKAVGKEGVFVTPEELVVVWDGELQAIALSYASDPVALNRAFAFAWTKLMNADRFKGPAGSECAAERAEPEYTDDMDGADGGDGGSGGIRVAAGGSKGAAAE